MHRKATLLLAVALLLLPSFSLAEIYAFVDAKGVWHYTNVPGDKRYKPVDQLSKTQKKQRRGVSARVRQGLAGYEGMPRSRYLSGHAGNYDYHISRIASRYQIDPHLVKAVIKAESNFDSRAISPKGAQGLMQLMPETARDLAVRNPFDPAQNIDGGTRYLRQMLNSYQGDLVKTLAAYNAGPARVALHGGLPPIPETREYVKRVLRHYKGYRFGLASNSNSITVGDLTVR